MCPEESRWRLKWSHFTPCHSLSQRRMTLAGSPSNRFTGAKQNKTVGLNTSAQGHRLQSSNLLQTALYFVISVGVGCGSGSINASLLLPSVCEQCQRNRLEIRVGFKQSKCLWGWVSEALPYTAEYSVFTLFQMGPVLWLTTWYDFTELRKGLACWSEMICNCEWCLYYFKYGSTGYHSLPALVNKPSQNEIRTVVSH